MTDRRGSADVPPAPDDWTVPALREAYLAAVDSGDHEAAADYLAHQGTLLASVGRIAEAIPFLTAARETYERLGIERESARCDLNLGVAFHFAGEYEEAERKLLAARSTFAGLELATEVARCEGNLGSVLRARGRYEEAVAYTLAARATFDNAGEYGAAARCDHRLGTLFTVLGRHHDAVRAFVTARDEFDRRAMRADVALCDQGLGVALRLTGRPEQAEESLRRARAVFVRNGAEIEAARCDHNLGAVYGVQRRFAEAEGSLLSARQAYSVAGRWEDVAHIDLTRARLMLEAVDADNRSPGGQRTGTARGLLARWMRKSSPPPDEAPTLGELLEVVIPAALALDTVRFELTSGIQRRRWSEAHVKAGMVTALRLAHDLGDTRLAAELIETIRAIGSPDLGGAGPLSADLRDVTLPADDDGADGAEEGTDEVPAALATPAGAYDPSHPQVRLVPPGMVRMPDGREALAPFHALAERRYGRTSSRHHAHDLSSLM